MSLALAVLAIFLLFAVLVLASQDAARSGNLRGGTAYCPPPLPADPPTPPEPRVRYIVAHRFDGPVTIRGVTIRECTLLERVVEAHDEDDEQTVLDSQGGGR